MTHDDDLTAHLGPTYTHATPEQQAELRAAATTIAARYPDHDDTQHAALTAAAQVILGETTLTDTVQQYADAQRTADAMHAAMTGAIIATDEPETTIAARTGLSRVTVRKAKGKAPHRSPKGHAS